MFIYFYFHSVQWLIKQWNGLNETLDCNIQFLCIYFLLLLHTYTQKLFQKNFLNVPVIYFPCFLLSLFFYLCIVLGLNGFRIFRMFHWPVTRSCMLSYLFLEVFVPFSGNRENFYYSSLPNKKTKNCNTQKVTCAGSIYLYFPCVVFFRISKSAPLLFSVFARNQINQIQRWNMIIHTHSQSQFIFYFFIVWTPKRKIKRNFFLTLFLYNTKNWNKSFFW